MNQLSEEKKRARKIIREKLADYTSEQLDSMSRVVTDRLSGLPRFAAAGVVMLYVSYAREVATHDLICRLLAQGKRVLVPRCGAGFGMDVFEIKDFNKDLSPGYKGILEPDAQKCRMVDPLDIDVLIAPLVGFSVERYRLGQGKGFYDRFVNRLSNRCLKIGLAFECQKLETLPVERHDMRLDVVATELEMYTDKIETR